MSITYGAMKELAEYIVTYIDEEYTRANIPAEIPDKYVILEAIEAYFGGAR